MNDGGRSYKFNLIISFWLSIHLEKLSFTQLLYEKDDILGRIVVNIIKQFKKMPESSYENLVDNDVGQIGEKTVTRDAVEKLKKF